VKGWRKKALAVLTAALGTSLAVATLNIALDVGDKVNRELRSYGANILVTPQVERATLEIGTTDYNPLTELSYLPQEELPNIKTIFWKYNIVGFAPYLSAGAEMPTGEEVTIVGTWFQNTIVIPTGETVTTGVKDIKSWWRVEGDWPEDKPDSNSVLVGQALAQRLSLKPGDTVTIAVNDRDHALGVSGVVSAGGDDDKQLFVPIGWLQEATGLQGKVSQVEVSALTTPENDLARKAKRLGTDALSREEFLTWYCSAFVDSISYQIEEAIPGSWARPIRQIADSEGAILSRVQALMALLALAAAVSSVLGISSLMGAAALDTSKKCTVDMYSLQEL